MRLFENGIFYCEADSLKGIYDHLVGLTKPQSVGGSILQVGDHCLAAPSQLHIEKRNDGVYCSLATFNVQQIGIAHPHSNGDGQYLHIWNGNTGVHGD